MQKSKKLEAMLTGFEDYNRRRIHSALKYMTPPEFAGQYRQDTEGVMPDIGSDVCE